MNETSVPKELGVLAARTLVWANHDTPLQLSIGPGHEIMPVLLEEQ